MASTAMDTPGPAPFDTFEPLPISAASFSGEVAFWQTSIAAPFMLLLAIFAVAGALTSGGQRPPFTRGLEEHFSINDWLAAGYTRVEHFVTRTPIPFLSLTACICFRRNPAVIRS